MWNHIRFHPSSGKHLINFYKSLTTNLALMMSYTALLSFKRTSSVASIFSWPYYPIFSRAFPRLFPEIEELPVQKMLYIRKNTGQKIPSLFRPIPSERVKQNWLYFHLGKIDFSQIKKFAYLKNNTAFLMILSNLWHYDTTKKPKQSENLLDGRKAFDATDHEISDWIMVTWGAPQRST